MSHLAHEFVSEADIFNAVESQILSEIPEININLSVKFICKNKQIQFIDEDNNINCTAVYHEWAEEVWIITEYVNKCSIGKFTFKLLIE